MNRMAAIERAQHVADLDELKQFMKESKARNMELVQFEIETTQNFLTHSKDIKNILEGCMRLIDCDEELSKRMDQISARIDIVNKRLRKLEQSK